MDGADRLKSGDHPERRRLAAAGRSDEHHELLVADLQIDVFDSVHAVVELVDPLEDDLSHWSHLPPNRLFAFCMRAFQSPLSGGAVSLSPIRSIPRRSAQRKTNSRYQPESIRAGRPPPPAPQRIPPPGSTPMCPPPPTP